MRRRGEKQAATFDLMIGALPCAAIHKALSLELGEGKVVLSRGAQRHAMNRHPRDMRSAYRIFLQSSPIRCISATISKNAGKIELVGRIRSAAISILVAVKVERNARGEYQIASFYPVSEDKIENRRRRGFLKPA